MRTLSTTVLLITLVALLPAADGESGEAVAMMPHAEGLWVFDHQRLGETILAEDREAIRDLRIAVGHSPRENWLGDSLDLLAAEDEAYALRMKRWADGSWLRREGGIGTYRVGRDARPDTRVEAFGTRMGRRDFAADLDAATLLFSRDDISPGRRVEISHKVHRVRFDIRATSVTLNGVLTDNITAQRVFGRGAGSGGVVFTNQFPIELPNVEYRGVNTSAVAPAGSGGRPGVVSQIETRPELHSRDSRVASRTYAEAMAALGQAYPDTAWVWVTVPLEPAENFQRNAYNHFLRAFLSGDRATEDPIDGDHLLFDVAAVLSHDAEGTLVMDRQGPVIAPDWLAEDGRSLNHAGQRRVAETWWHLMNHLAIR